MSWADGPLAAFDLETTGPDPRTARIVTATVLRIDGTQIAEHAWISDVDGHEIPDDAAAVHGITTEFAREHGQPAAEVAHDVRDALAKAWADGAPVVVFNAAYDCTVMAAECDRHQLAPFTIDGPVVDPYVIDKRVDRYRRGSRRLSDQCAHYRVQLDSAHTSSDDALAAARLAWRLAHAYPTDVGDVDLPTLHERQTRWHAEQADSFEAYLCKVKAREGATPDEIAAVRVDRGWPIRSAA